MNERARLERGYRRVLACYPKAFRCDSGAETLAALLASAEEGQRRVGLAESASLLRGALRMRLRPPARPPRTVRGAVRLMCLGAVVQLAALVTMVVTTASVRAAFAREPGLTAAHLRTMLLLLILREVIAALAVGLWLFIAWAAAQGRDAARFTFSAFFALTTGTVIIALAQHDPAYAPADMIAATATWLIALATMILIFARPSNAYYRMGPYPPVVRTLRQPGPPGGGQPGVLG